MTRKARDATPFIALDSSSCTACWECVAACPHEVIGKVDLWFHHHAVVRHAERCAGCRRCVRACVSGALTASHAVTSASGAEPRASLQS